MDHWLAAAAETVAAADPEVAALIREEAARREGTIDLIASESEPTAPVLAALGSAFAGKTAEGFPGRRYHRGTRHIDEVERLATARAVALFGAGHANVQPASGVNANLAVYRALLQPGDPVLSMQLAHGGHLSHGDRASLTGAVYRFANYGVDPRTEQVDLDQVRDLARAHRPRLIVAGGSSYPRVLDYAAIAGIAREVEAAVLVDMAHIAGLVAAGVHPSPVPHADVVTFTTYKTMLGPHGGVILARGDLARRIDRAVFPGTQGTPDFGHVAAKAVAFAVAATPAFRATQAAIVENARALAAALAADGDRIVAGGTDTHMVLVDLRARGLTGDVAEDRLESAGILANRNVIPFDPGTPDRPSGLRLGATAISQRGLRAADAATVAGLVDGALRADDPVALDAIRGRVRDLAQRFPLDPGAPGVSSAR
jgi:glycine hydroxymethyltransferase